MIEPTFIVTSRFIKERYRAVLEAQACERNAAAAEWQHLHRWEWRKRRRLHRILYGGGGWRVPGVEGIPECVARCPAGPIGPFYHMREGGC